MFEASHVQYHIVSGYIQIVSDGHYLPAFWAHPEMGGPFPGLVLLHDRWGLTAHIRNQARRFAELGYYVIAPDLFNRQTADSPEQAQMLVDQLSEAARSYVSAALNALKTHNRCNGKMGLIGWGMGGRLALQTGIVRDDLKALVIFYDLPEPLLPAALRVLSCPLLGFFAAQDSETPLEQVERLRAVLAEMNAGHEIVIYPDVGRGFFDDSRSTFHPVAAQDAWMRTQTFLDQQLEVIPPSAAGPGHIY